MGTVVRGFEPERQVYVCHFDILGMKSVLARSNFEAWQTICDLADAQDNQELPITVDSRNSLTERFFSDTIIISTSDDSAGALHTILARSFEIFRSAFRSSIPLRGGIAYGSWFESSEQERELFTGDALLRAYDLGESQQMLGICICDVIRQRFSKTPFRFRSGEPVIKDYPVPLKKGVRINRAVLNWPAICRQELTQINKSEANSLAQYFFGFGKPDTLPEEVMTKYTNTVEFIRCAG
jgi:hypothetical protein